ncbi:MAG TPA: hypothetical protein P5137_13550, partial [Candidatus Brocadiia bacterium]|nr:hypothetical protein [Candidatus Brocadiia bacterium]
AGPAKAQLPTDRLCRHVTRLTAWAGEPCVQVEHVWIVTFDSRKVRIRNIGIGVKPAEAEKVSLALNSAPSEYPAAKYPSVRLYQRSYDLASLETDGPETLGRSPKEWKPFGEDAAKLSNTCTLRAPGEEAGWVTLDGKKAGVTLFIRDVRQLYPKELECADGRLWAHIWPRHGRPFYNVGATSAQEIYKLWWVHEGRELNFQTPPQVFDALTEYGNNLGYSWAGQFANAMGVGVQTQLLLWFHPAGLKTDQIKRTCDLFQLEPDAQPDPQWSCDSLAYGHIFPRDDKAFPEVERYFEFAFKRNCFLMDRARDYGMFNYRDYHNGAYGLGPDGKWRWGTYRVWESTHYGHNKAILQMYARTGDPYYYAEARRNVRHLMNVDVVQYDDPSVDLFKGWNFYGPSHYYTHKVGASYHAKGFVHWGGDLSLLNHYSNFDDIYWHYLLRGDLRAREVALRWAEEVKKIGRIEDVQSRGGHAPASSLLTLFQNTQDPALLLIIDDFQGRFYANFTQITKDSNSFNFAPFSANYLDYAGSETARRALTTAGGRAYDGGYGKPTILAAAAYRENSKECPYWNQCMESVFWQSAKCDQRGPFFDPRDTGFIGYHAWGDALRYWLPFLKILREKGTPIAPPARLEGQAYPPYALVCFRKEPNKPVRLVNRLAEVRKGKQDAYDVRLLSGRLGDPAIARVVKLNSATKPGEGETLVPSGEPAGVRYAAAILGSPAVLLPLTDAQEMVVLPKGVETRFTEGVWYFRTAPGQKELALALRWSRHQDPGNLFFQIRSADRKQLLASYTDSEDIRLAVQPDTLYCVVCSKCGLASPDRDFYIARQPEDIFAAE